MFKFYEVGGKVRDELLGLTNKDIDYVAVPCEEALKETIRLDIHMQAAAGNQVILMAPGNYGEKFFETEMGISPGKAVLCSCYSVFSAGTVDTVICS